MNHQHHKPNDDWETVLYDFTDKLGENQVNLHNEIMVDLMDPTEVLQEEHRSVLDCTEFFAYSGAGYEETKEHQRTLDNHPESLQNNLKTTKSLKRSSQVLDEQPEHRVSSKHTTQKNLSEKSESNEELYLPELNSKGWKQRKECKQHIYSKNYRERKKEEFKLLEEENAFLKKKIDELQSRIRETETELNKLKHNQQENGKPIMELNHTWISRIKELLNSNSTTEEALYKDFANSYDDYGFAGKQKIFKLNYHMNEFLENVLKDSEKYMALTVINNIGLLGDSPDLNYQEINYTIFEIMEYDQNKLETCKKFLGPYLKPSMERIQKSCQKLYDNFQQVFTEIYQTHEYLKASKNKDFLSIKQRLQMESWFQENKYSKEIRQLRWDWENSIKNKEESSTDFETMRKKVSLHNE